MSPLPLRERIAGALRLEPMSESELCRVLCVARRDVHAALEVMHARGDVRQLPQWAGWINARRQVSRLAA